MNPFAMVDISAEEFRLFQSWVARELGIQLNESKTSLIRGRLHVRLRRLNLRSFREYFDLVSQPGSGDEREQMIDLLTTHETRFFREPTHFEFLEKLATDRSASAGPLRVWSAACSSGEEAYSAALVLGNAMGLSGWSVFGSDVSVPAVQKAAEGVYPMRRESEIAPAYLKRFGMRGVRSMHGTFTFDPGLRKAVTFAPLNLMSDHRHDGLYDVVFLSNVLIYFGQQAKKDVLRRVLQKIKPGGYLFAGRSESMNIIGEDLKWVRHSIYCLQK